jgi:predicted nicotinamide N-methyase
LRTSFPYRTRAEELRIGGETLDILRLNSLDETIDEFFREYEKSGNAELFESLCPYFGEPWPAGKALAAYALERAPAWSGASVLELGCGLALPSLLLAKKGFSRLEATDAHPDVEAFLAENCRRNGVSVAFRPLDWGEESADAQVILGSDLLYDKAQAPRLLEFLGRSSWGEAVLADPGRPYWESFVREAKGRWRVEEFLREGIFFLTLHS